LIAVAFRWCLLIVQLQLLLSWFDHALHYTRRSSRLLLLLSVYWHSATSCLI
jgi:hypothetical protein